MTMNDDLNTPICILERAGIPIAEVNIWRGFEKLPSSDARKLLQSLSFLSENEILALHGFLKQKSDLLKSGSIEEIQRLIAAERMFIENI